MEIPKIFISDCCRAKVIENFGDNPIDDEYICKECNNVCERAEVCELCFGTGELDKLEPVYQNEPHMAYTGTEKCFCQKNID